MVIEAKKYDNGRQAMPLKERVLLSIRITDDGCWEWTKKTLNKWGYARITIGSRRDGTRRTAMAHRVSYEAFIGEIPDNLALDHLCMNRKCANPFHLEPVTTTENNNRMRRARCKICNSLKQEKYGRFICVECQRRRIREWMRKSKNVQKENYRV